MRRTTEARTKQVEILLDDGTCLYGHLRTCGRARGVVLFVRARGDRNLSKRNQYAMDLFARSRLSSLQADLLTRDEQALDLLSQRFRYNIGLLMGRILALTKWLSSHESTKNLKVGYFAPDSAAAAAIAAAAELGPAVTAVVCLAGLCDLAKEQLSRIISPILLIAGARDPVTLDMNRRALEVLKTDKRLEIISGATHLFEEPTAFQQAVTTAAQWFDQHFAKAAAAATRQNL